MKYPNSTPASSAMVSALAILASSLVATAQNVQTEQKSETRTAAGGTIKTTETKTTESVLPRPGLTRIEGVIARRDQQTGKMMVRAKTSKEPIGFVLNPATKLTDLDGKPLAESLLTTDIPVVVYYAEDKNTLVASDIQAQRYQVPMPDGTTTLTNRETLKAGGKEVSETTTVKTTMVKGTVARLNSDGIFLNVEGNKEPVIYNSGTATAYFNAAGEPIAVESLKPGVPVTISYIQEGDKMLARQITLVKAGEVKAPVKP